MNIGRKPFPEGRVVVAGQTYFGDRGDGRMMDFPIREGERRSSTDPAVLACPSLWYLDGEEGAWRQEAAERRDRFFESHRG